MVLRVASHTSYSLLCVPTLNLATFRGPSFLLSRFPVDCARKLFTPFLQGVQPLPETQSQVSRGIFHSFYLLLFLLTGCFSCEITEPQHSGTSHLLCRSGIISLHLTKLSCPVTASPKNTYSPFILNQVFMHKNCGAKHQVFSGSLSLFLCFVSFLSTGYRPTNADPRQKRWSGAAELGGTYLPALDPLGSWG